MKTTIALPALAALSLPLLLAWTPRADELSFQPKEGSRLEKELELDLRFFLEDLRVSVDGQEMPAEMMGEMDEAIVINALISVTDEYVSSQRNKHAELLRTFDELSLEGGTESEVEPADGFDDFEGTTVRFKWDEEESAYTKTIEDGAGDEDELDQLSVDMDFLTLLPDGEVEEGDTWTVSGEKLAGVFLPGGMLPLPTDEEDDEVSQLLEDELGAQLEEAFQDFEVECTYKGSRDDDGARIGEIALDFDGQASIDLSELIQTIADMQSGQQDVDIETDILATIDLEFTGDGTLLWNLAGHRPRAFSMTSEMVVLADVEADIEAMGESQSMALSAEISGDGTWKLATSEP